MSNLDLEGQTAPESTRGLFGPLPEVNYVHTNLQAMLLTPTLYRVQL